MGPHVSKGHSEDVQIACACCCCRSGLEGQLLGLTIQHEQPALESQRTTLLQQEEKSKLQLAALEKQLLQSLATSKVSNRCCL